MIRMFVIAWTLAAFPLAAVAAPCSRIPDALDTARMLPAFLRALKRRSYCIVQIVPAGRGRLLNWPAPGTVAFLPAFRVFYRPLNSVIFR